MRESRRFRSGGCGGPAPSGRAERPRRRGGAGPITHHPRPRGPPAHTHITRRTGRVWRCAGARGPRPTELALGSEETVRVRPARRAPPARAARPPADGGKLRRLRRLAAVPPRAPLGAAGRRGARGGARALRAPELPRRRRGPPRAAWPAGRRGRPSPSPPTAGSSGGGRRRAAAAPLWAKEGRGRVPKFRRPLRPGAARAPRGPRRRRRGDTALTCPLPPFPRPAGAREPHWATPTHRARSLPRCLSPAPLCIPTNNHEPGARPAPPAAG